MLSHKMDFNCCVNRDGFRIGSHICTTTLRKTTPIGNPSFSEVVRRLAKYMCVHTVNCWLQWLLIFILFNLQCCITIVFEKKLCRNQI